ncbi:HTH-type transcriptional repressor YvoA [Acidibacillus sp. S0AB]|uniref:HTH-type transcriptional repressor YvoA n=1 Tax=Sulfoacidibacillus ferrooxidans TaxID=2005001 RepID=A0A9X1V8Z8_9BACL|nr:HTH-type transcriptional repressor YvoA [Sulfoacidibacillus ferrooxidans]
MLNSFIPRQRLARESIEEILAASRPGDRIPSEDQLVKQLGISRPTIRSALSALEQEGLVIRKHGVGTFVSGPLPSMNASLEALYSVADIVRNNGYEPSVADIHVEHLILPVAVCEKLKVTKNTPGYRVKRTILADGQPAVFLVDYLPTSIQNISVNLSDFSDKMLPTLSRLGICISYAIADLTIKRTTEEAAEALHIAADDPVLFLQQVAYTPDHAPVIYSHGYHREGLVTYTLTRKVELSERISK